MLHVYLDDCRICPKGFTLAKNMDECMLLLREYDIGVLSLDCHLGWDEPNGVELVKAMIKEQLYAQQIYLHSSDAFCRKQMFDMLNAHKPDQVQVYLFPVPSEQLMKMARAEDT